MSIKIASDWRVIQAVNGRDSGGRFICNSHGTEDERMPAFPGYDGNTIDGTEFRAESDRFYAAVVKWLTGKDTGANILLCTGAAPTPEGHPFGQEFQAGLSRMGHTYTISGTILFTDGGLYDPLDYDMVCVQGNGAPSPYHGVYGTVYDRWHYLLYNGGSALMEASTFPLVEWGFQFNASPGHWYATHPVFPKSPTSVDCEAEFGEAADYHFVQHENVDLSANDLPNDPDFELISGTTYRCLANSHGGNAWVKACNTTHTPPPDNVLTPGVLGFWTKT